MVLLKDYCHIKQKVLFQFYCSTLGFHFKGSGYNHQWALSENRDETIDNNNDDDDDNDNDNDNIDELLQAWTASFMTRGFDESPH